MQKLIPVIGLLIMLAAGTTAQVNCTITQQRGPEGVRYSIDGNEAEIDAWRNAYAADLFAWPTDLDIALETGIPAFFDFGPAYRVILVVEREGTGTLEVVHKRGEGRNQSIEITPGQRQLIEIRNGQFRLSYISSNSEQKLRITRAYVEQAPENMMRDFGFGTSSECHPNAKCPENDPWSDQIRSAVRIMIVLEEGTGWCTGSLVNNTSEDGTPLILSGEHCLATYTPLWDLWRFDFNYLGETCENPADEPEFNSLSGAMLRAKHRDTDFMLLELEDDIPVAFMPFFSGWNRTDDYLPNKVALIHHPSGDIKKVSRDIHEIKVWDKEINWNEGYSTPANTHYRSRFDFGAFEGGSSGGGLYDLDGYLVGQLHGGSGDCVLNSAYSGRLSQSWDYGPDPSSRARDWLDPLGLDTLMILDGMEHPDQGNTFAVNGTVRDPQGREVSGIVINTTGGIEMAIEADSTGNFTFDLLPRSESIEWTPSKPGADQTNGVSATDLLLIKKHLLGDVLFTEEWQYLAADATGNGDLSAGDLLQLQKLLLGLIPQLQAQEAWVFLPGSVTTQNPPEDILDMQFTAIKVGDINGNADPKY